MKSIKRIAMLAMVILVVLSMVAAFAACGDGEEADSNDDSSTTTTTKNEPTTPTTGGNDNGDGDEEVNPNLVKVTVVDHKGKPVKDAIIQICQGETCFAKPIITDSTGAGTREYTLGEGQLKAKILSVTGYEDFIAPESYVYFEENGPREIQIQIKQIAVNVFDQNDKAVEGAAVQVYQGDNAIGECIYTDANGLATAFVMANPKETLGVKITEILSGSDYNLSSEISRFDEGSYETVVVVNKRVSYSVKIDTFMGSEVAGLKVELYDADTNRKKKTAYTDENGIVRFENLDTGNYYVKVTIESPAYTIMTASTDGKYMFGNNTSITIEIVEIKEITYTINAPASMANMSASVYGKNFAYITNVSFDENGVGTFIAPNSDYIVLVDSFFDEENYYYPIFFAKNDSAVAEAKTVVAKPGSCEEYPIYLTEGAGFYFEAGETKWYCIPFASEKLLEAYSYANDLTLDFDGDVVTVGADIFRRVFPKNTDKIVFSVTVAQGTAEGSFSVSAPGSYNSPFDVNGLLDSDSNMIVNINGSIVYYEYTASEDGVVKFMAQNAFVVISVDGMEVPLRTTEDGNGVYVLVPMKAGEKIKLYFEAYNESFEPTIIEELPVSVTFGKETVSYTVQVSLDLVATSGIEVILYKWNGTEYVEIARGTTDENGRYVFENIEFLADYAVGAVVPENYELISGIVDFGYATETQIYISHVRDGSANYPIIIDYGTGLGTISVDKNGVSWLEINIKPSYDGSKWLLVLNSANAQFKVYFADTNEDGVVDEKDTPVGMSNLVDGVAMYTFNDNDKLFKIAISTVNGEAEEISIIYSKEEAEAGSSYDSAKDFEESAGDVGTITAGQTIYFRYTGEACKLTVTLLGENVTLKRVTKSLENEDEIFADVEGNSFVIEDTEHEWIYFVVVADADTNYEVVITAE